MRAKEISARVVKELRKKRFDTVVCNFANGDMVGHTGNLKACIQSMQTLDKSVQKIAEETLRQNGFLIVTADLGNCESMGTKKRPQKNHTTNPVPCWIVSNQTSRIRRNGGIASVAPTFLELMGIQKPLEMKAKRLVVHAKNPKEQ
jgi:2,3-bisphosphoglycerate-independent phosphoglycerate mutase